MAKLVRNYPRRTLEKALVIASAIVEKGAGQPMDRLLVADAVGRTPSSSEFKMLLSCSRSYGLTVGTEKADNISLTDLGSKILKPTHPSDETHGKLEALLKVESFRHVLEKFDKSRLPDTKFLQNTLEKSFGIDSNHSDEFVEILLENANFVGVIQEISGSDYVRLSAIDSGPTSNGGQKQPSIDDDLGDLTQSAEGATPTIDPSILQEDDSAGNSPTSEEKANAPSKPKQLFVAHGKNHPPLNELKKILDEFKIPYKVAIDEANKGQPISRKVAKLMQECSAIVKTQRQKK